MYTNVPGVKLLTNGKIIVTPNHVYAGQNKLDLTKDTVYRHPSSKQCNYYVDLSNYVTKSELSTEITGSSESIKEDLKGMMDMSGRLIHSAYLYNDNMCVAPSDADYCVIKHITGWIGYMTTSINSGTTQIHDAMSATMVNTETKVVKHGTGAIQIYGNWREYLFEAVVVRWMTNNQLLFDQRIDCAHVEFYSYS